MHGLTATVLTTFLLCLAAGFLPAQDQPNLQQEVVVRWWLVPVYAMNKDGSPAVGLQEKDLAVYLNRQQVPLFDLHRKEFRVAEPKQPPPAGPTALPPPFERKLVLLVFDSAFSNSEVLDKAKNVSKAMLAQEAQGARFLVLSIEPFGGLKTILGPTRDRDLVARNIERYVFGKKADRLRTSATDFTGVRNVDPPGRPLFDRNPDEPRTPGRWAALPEKLDAADKRRTASIYAQALMTLDLILGYFKDNSKVIYLFSRGIPAEALERKSDGAMDASIQPEEGVYSDLAPDTFNLKVLVNVARSFNRNGSLIFLINPAGKRLSAHDRDSGEPSLRILADESGGRYYAGPDEEIAREITRMESAYYEISFPDAAEYQGADMDLEIRPLKPDLEICTVKRVSRGREYRQMTRLEKQVLVLNLLDRGPYAQTLLKVVEAEWQPVGFDRGRLHFSVRPPRELSRSEWDVFKVWRKPDAGKIVMETDRVLSKAPDLAVDMKQRPGFRHDLVLVNGQTGTTLVLQK